SSACRFSFRGRGSSQEPYAARVAGRLHPHAFSHQGQRSKLRLIALARETVRMPRSSRGVSLLGREVTGFMPNENMSVKNFAGKKKGQLAKTMRLRATRRSRTGELRMAPAQFGGARRKGMEH